MAGKARKPKYDWRVVFEHGDKTVMANGSKLGASAESQIRGAMRENNLARAEIALLGQAVKTVKVNGETEFSRDRGQNGADIPSWPDEHNVTTDEKLLQYIVTVVAPHLSDKYPEAFDVYYLDDDDIFWDTDTETGVNPTNLSSVGHTESQDEEAI